MSKRIPAPAPKTITRKQVMANFPKRPRDSHKGMFGSVAVIGGASGMIGAPLLAARAALKLGAGCVHVGLLADNAPTVDLLQPELMLHRADDALIAINKHPLPQSLPHREREAKPFSHRGKGWEGGKNLSPNMETSINAWIMGTWTNSTNANR